MVSMDLGSVKGFAGNRGFILFPTLMLVILLLVIGLAVLELAATEAKISDNQRLAVEALYLAEAGVQMAIHMLELDPAWRQGYRDYPLGRGLIKEVTVNHGSHSVIIESQAEVLGAGRRVRAELTKIPVPYAQALATTSLRLLPGAQIRLQGEAVHYGDFHLSGGRLEGILTVEGTALLSGGSFRGALAATGEITVTGDAEVAGTLVSAQAVTCTLNTWQAESFGGIPVLLPPQAPLQDLNWYYRQPHFPVEEPVLDPGELVSGLYIATGDLSLLGDSTLTYQGSIALVVPGTLFVGENLVPENPETDTLLLAAETIVIAPWVTEMGGILVATEAIVFEGGTAAKRIRGTMTAPLIILEPGFVDLAYHPYAGTHLVPAPETLFRVSRWQEIMLM